MVRIHVRGSDGYEASLAALSRRGEADLARVEPTVREILDAIRARGDAALAELTERFDGHRPVPPVRSMPSLASEAARCPSDVRMLLEHAADRIRDYHLNQRDAGFHFERDGVSLGMRVRPVASAGVYAPGGKARYPSTVLMTAIPAAVAGVKRIVLATPRPTPEILAAAEIAGVTEVLDAGGAQAIGALAYGTESVRPVEKIVGPGNLYVACAKKLVYGHVSIDSIAGPSEILVIADEGADPKVVAADLLSQAEHDEDAYALLVTLDRATAEAVARELEAQVEGLPRAGIARASLERHAEIFVAVDRAEAARIADAMAPEHLCLAVADPESMLDEIHAVGAAFLGDHTPEAAGDYAAGPSHVLPTGGAARFSSPLGVYDFIVRTSVIKYSPEAIETQADLLEGLARLEGLEAHARAVSARRGLKPR
jgi:histidinol dehydrogenase